MAERKYSVSEIDRMRSAVRRLIVSENIQMQEEYLRTYMLNGSGPEELDRHVLELDRISLEKKIELCDSPSRVSPEIVAKARTRYTIELASVVSKLEMIGSC